MPRHIAGVRAQAETEILNSKALVEARSVYRSETGTTRDCARPSVSEFTIPEQQKRPHRLLLLFRSPSETQAARLLLGCLPTSPWPALDRTSPFQHQPHDRLAAVHACRG